MSNYVLISTVIHHNLIERHATLKRYYSGKKLTWSNINELKRINNSVKSVYINQIERIRLTVSKKGCNKWDVHAQLKYLNNTLKWYHTINNHWFILDVWTCLYVLLCYIFSITTRYLLKLVTDIIFWNFLLGREIVIRYMLFCV